MKHFIIIIFMSILQITFLFGQRIEKTDLKIGQINEYYFEIYDISIDNRIVANGQASGQVSGFSDLRVFDKNLLLISSFKIPQKEFSKGISIISAKFSPDGNSLFVLYNETFNQFGNEVEINSLSSFDRQFKLISSFDIKLEGGENIFRSLCINNNSIGVLVFNDPAYNYKRNTRNDNSVFLRLYNMASRKLESEIFITKYEIYEGKNRSNVEYGKVLYSQAKKSFIVTYIIRKNNFYHETNFKIIGSESQKIELEVSELKSVQVLNDKLVLFSSNNLNEPKSKLKILVMDFDGEIISEWQTNYDLSMANSLYFSKSCMYIFNSNWEILGGKDGGVIGKYGYDAKYGSVIKFISPDGSIIVTSSGSSYDPVVFWRNKYF